MLHLFLHFLIPLIVSVGFIKHLRVNFPINLNHKLPNWLKAWIFMLLTMLVDIDHLLATPIYQIDRCSIGFHPLHTILPIGFYLLLCFPKKTRVIGLGLIIHMILDSIDCLIHS